jgi:hypothetical protein
MASEHFQQRQEKIRENEKWVGAGVGAVCMAGLLALLQAPKLSVALEVASVGFVIGLAGAIGLLVLWEHAENMPDDSAGSSGALELMFSGIGAVTGIGAVVVHLNPVAAVVGLFSLMLLLSLDTILTIRNRRATSSKPS